MALVSKDDLSVLEMVTDPKKRREVVFAKSSASLSTASDCDCHETFSCHSLSDVEEEREAEDEETLRSRAATGVSLGDWWEEGGWAWQEGAWSERARGSTRLTEFDFTGTATTRLLQEDDDADSHLGGRRTSFATHSTNATLTHSFPLAADCGSVIVCPVADDRLSLSIRGRTDADDSGDNWGQEELHMELKVPQEGAEVERESVAPLQLKVPWAADPAADFAHSSCRSGGKSQSSLAEEEEEKGWGEPSVLAFGSAVSDVAASVVEDLSEAATTAMVSTVSEAAGAAWSLVREMSSMLSECSLEDTRHADSRVSIHMAVSGSMLW